MRFSNFLALQLPIIELFPLKCNLLLELSEYLEAANPMRAHRRHSSILRMLEQGSHDALGGFLLCSSISCRNDPSGMPRLQHVPSQQGTHIDTESIKLVLASLGFRS